jgi:excisionase family DNA binding protein
MDTQRKEAFSTGEVARFCRISQQTVIRCFDKGRIKGFRIPGSGFRRVPREALLQFMQENDMAVSDLQPDRRKVLIVDDDAEVTRMLRDLLQADGRFEVRTAPTRCDAGLLAEKFGPDVILLGRLQSPADGATNPRTIRGPTDAAHIQVTLVSGVVRPEQVRTLAAAGANSSVRRPHGIDRLITRIAEPACGCPHGDHP